jgi:hypothetical protein
VFIADFPGTPLGQSHVKVSDSLPVTKCVIGKNEELLQIELVVSAAGGFR